MTDEDSLPVLPPAPLLAPPAPPAPPIPPAPRGVSGEADVPGHDLPGAEEQAQGLP